MNSTQKQSRTHHRIRRAAAASAVVAATTAASFGGLAVAAPKADAAGFAIAYTNGDGVALRSSPSAGSKISPMIVLRDGTPITIICQVRSADAMGPRANHIFNRISYPSRSGQTWVPDAYVSGTAAANQFTTRIPRCSGTTSPPTSKPPTSNTSSGEKAIAWMTARIGSTKFDGVCLAAVYQAYLAGGRDITAGLPQGPARDSAYAYWSVAKNKHAGAKNPPRGALVFFKSPSGSAPGHVAISLGNGQMISTYDSRTRGIHVMASSSYQQSLYLGWVGV